VSPQTASVWAVTPTRAAASRGSRSRDGLALLAMPSTIGEYSDNCNGFIRSSWETPTPAAQLLAAAPTAVCYAPVAKRARSKWDLGKKVALLLRDRQNNGQKPATGEALAEAISELGVPCDSGTVYGWIKDGARPRSDRARLVAQVLGVPFDWLTDDAQAYPPKSSAASPSVALSSLPEDQREVLERILRDPLERRAWIASWNARHSRS
jgi:hypothetical protein